MSHMRAHNDQPLTCRKCKTVFERMGEEGIKKSSNSERLKRHQKWCTGITSVVEIDLYRGITCDICQKYLPRRELIHNHMKFHNDKPLQCANCKKIFERESSAQNTNVARLKKHMVYCSAPKKQPSHQCSGCQVDFKNKKLLKSHVSKCSPVEFKCGICLGTFASKSSLGKHYCKPIPEADIQWVVATE